MAGEASWTAEQRVAGKEDVSQKGRPLGFDLPRRKRSPRRQYEEESFFRKKTAIDCASGERTVIDALGVPPWGGGNWNSRRGLNV